MVSKLSDQEVRALLLERLDAVARESTTEPETQSINVLELVQSWGSGIVQNWTTGGERMPEFGAALVEGFSTFVERKGGYETLMTFLKMGLGILMGLVAYFSCHGQPIAAVGIASRW